MRTTPKDVQDVLGPNYDTINCPSLMPYLRSASLIIDDVVDCATESLITLSDARLAEMEKWIAAYLYTITDPIYKTKQTANSSASYFDRSYLDAAKSLDKTGCLAAILTTGARAGMDWLGKRPSEQIDIDDRN